MTLIGTLMQVRTTQCSPHMGSGQLFVNLRILVLMALYVSINF